MEELLTGDEVSVSTRYYLENWIIDYGIFFVNSPFYSLCNSFIL